MGFPLTAYAQFGDCPTKSLPHCTPLPDFFYSHLPFCWVPSYYSSCSLGNIRVLQFVWPTSVLHPTWIFQRPQSLAPLGNLTHWSHPNNFTTGLTVRDVMSNSHSSLLIPPCGFIQSPSLILRTCLLAWFHTDHDSSAAIALLFSHHILTFFHSCFHRTSYSAFHPVPYSSLGHDAGVVELFPSDARFPSLDSPLFPSWHVPFLQFLNSFQHFFFLNSKAIWLWKPSTLLSQDRDCLRNPVLFPRVAASSASQHWQCSLSARFMSYSFLGASTLRKQSRNLACAACLSAHLWSTIPFCNALTFSNHTSSYNSSISCISAHLSQYACFCTSHQRLFCDIFLGTYLSYWSFCYHSVSELSSLAPWFQGLSFHRGLLPLALWHLSTMLLPLPAFSKLLSYHRPTDQSKLFCAQKARWCTSQLVLNLHVVYHPGQNKYSFQY